MQPQPVLTAQNSILIRSGTVVEKGDVCVAEVTVNHQIRVAENIMHKLHPGDKIKIRIESIRDKKNKNTLKPLNV
ncbi:MAG: hypothetical protein GY757_04885 [bacterium]|nr:hypothetical protein [bacterium]